MLHWDALRKLRDIFAVCGWKFAAAHHANFCKSGKTVDES
jgi:hypothetical protein